MIKNLLRILLISLLLFLGIRLFFKNQETEARKQTQIIILCYHHIDCPWKTPYSITRKEFIKQIHSLRKAGFTYISTADLEDFLLKNKKIPLKSAVITFDDGFLNNYTVVYPMLKRLQIPWTFFIYPQVINQGRKKYAPTWSEVKIMADDGVIIGCHSLTHSMLTRKPRRFKTETQYEEWLDKEILFSKKVIEQNIGREVKYFAPPYGAYNKRIYEKAKDSGYVLVFNAKNKFKSDYSSDPYNLNRYIIRKTDKIESILSKIKQS